ncbi:MAG: hypothetical protein PHG56_06220 [Tissierellia bacterium]|nr:hypothetical protein [Tissierellia bacterium]MDD3227118.1 hypothetical protein [Tissierellia bacterium]MDD4677985.1 hypothetical protein [Tissierellia bacterium]
MPYYESIIKTKNVPTKGNIYDVILLENEEVTIVLQKGQVRRIEDWIKISILKDRKEYEMAAALRWFPLLVHQPFLNNLGVKKCIIMNLY